MFADTNAAELVPNGSRTWLVTGALDTISPPRVAYDYARRAQAAGDAAQVVILPDASHYDEVSSASPAWPLVLGAIERALRGADAVYVAFDADSVEPGELAVFMPEPGGLRLAEVEELLRDMPGARNAGTRHGPSIGRTGWPGDTPTSTDRSRPRW